MEQVLLVRPLFSGPLDIVGDVHGEIDALETLLSCLGYNHHGEHPQGRRLVFVGDLVDRGPDSPAVIERVMALVSRGLAQCLLGNHELNLLRGARKAGNAWLLDPERAEQQPGGEFAHSRVASPGALQAYLAFLASLPLALERSDLRVAHAAWLGGEIAALRRATGSVKDIYQTFEQATKAQLEMEGLDLRAQAELQRYKVALHARYPDGSPACIG